MRTFAHRSRTVAVSALAALALPVAAGAANGTAVGTPSATARSSHWIAVETPFTGDDNVNGHTTAKLGSSSTGPFTTPSWLGNSSGPAEWRADVFGFGNVSPSTTYFVQVEFFDPDGVVGPNPQVIGPVTTPAVGLNAVTVEAATADARDTEIYVTVPISEDANQNSAGTIDVATSPLGPWVTKCGGSPAFGPLPAHPKRCRIRSLTPGVDYWVRATIDDPDGVVGVNPQVLGPITYSGLENLALGKPITADPGWGCCPDPSQLVDGRIQNPAWFFGFAWTGGNGMWAGGAPGFKQATIDLGAPTMFNRTVAWYHDPGNVPVDWEFEHSLDGVTWTDAHVNAAPVCRTDTIPLYGAWYHPGCGHDASFPAVTARYVRYIFDDRTLFGGIHGWAVEIEVFLDPAREPQHFLRYQLDQPEATGETVTLVDQFGERRVRLEEAEWLWNPAEKRRTGRPVEPIQRDDEHLVCYGLPYISTADRFVTVRNQFATSTLRVGRPLTLCTPASKSLSGEVGPPPEDLDHFLCYDVRGETPLFTSETLVVRDQFGERTIRIDRARELCNPVEKRRDGREPEPIIRLEEHYVCYRITTQTPLFTPLGVFTRDQFFFQPLSVTILERLCVPSTKDEGGAAA